MVGGHLAPLAIAATERMIDGLASSDFVTNCGGHAINELRSFGADMANDIFQTFAGREADEAERASFVAAFPGSIG